MPRRYPPEFRQKVLDLVRTKRSVRSVALDLDVSAQTIYTWKAQEEIDLGLRPGLTSIETQELQATRKRIRDNLSLWRTSHRSEGSVRSQRGFGR